MISAEFDAVTAALGLSGKADMWRQDWPHSQGCFAPGQLPFMDAQALHETCRFMAMPREIVTALTQGMEIFEGNTALQRLAWHCRWALMQADEDHFVDMSAWPELPRRGNDAMDMFYAHVLMSAVPHVRELHRRRGIPESVTRDTLLNVESHMRNHRAKTGLWGVAVTAWLSNLFSARLFWLGRLQYKPACLPLDYHAFRRRSDRAVITLAGEGMHFRRDGQFDGTNNINDESGAWFAHFRRDAEVITGTPISPRGYALSREVALPAPEWDAILAQRDPIIEVHIPRKGRLDRDKCTESLKQALEFFPKHFPEQPFNALTCSSWLMDNQLADYLPPTSNIVLFLKRFYLLPLPGTGDKRTLNTVMGGPVDDLDKAPQDTSLQRAIVSHMKRGGRWRGAHGLLFADEVGRGEGIYRKQALP